jgi:large subunit ribosomal protein L7/L12
VHGAVILDAFWRAIMGQLAMAKLDDQISTLQQKLLKLKLRQQRIEARAQAIRAVRERKAETRRRILVGALVLEKMQLGEMDRRQIVDWLDHSLRSAADRALFGLPPLKAQTEG